MVGGEGCEFAFFCSLTGRRKVQGSRFKEGPRVPGSGFWGSPVASGVVMGNTGIPLEAEFGRWKLPQVS